MNADEFVAKLDQCRPSIQYLVEHGWLAEIAAEIVKDMTISLRKGEFRQMDDPLLDLLERYNTAAFSSGMVTLDPSTMTHIDRDALARLYLTPVGAEEAEPLVLDQRTGEIWLVHGWDYTRRAYRYSASSSQFLDALLLAAQYERPHVSQPPTFRLPPKPQAENERAAAEWAARCAAAAGLRADEPNPYRAMLGLVD